MGSKTLQLQLFMDEEDEKQFSLCLYKEYENIMFLDGRVWDDEPVIVKQINDCKANYCYIWNKNIFSDISILKRKDGRVEGPASGVVIQYARSKLDNRGFLLSGRIAVGYDTSDHEYEKFIKDVWKIIKKIARIGVFHYPEFGEIDRSKIIKTHAVGESVICKLKNGNIKGLRHMSTQVYYWPSTL